MIIYIGNKALFIEKVNKFSWLEPINLLSKKKKFFKKCVII